ncbi:MAG: glutamate synthase large subunit [Candidatus Omnitrophota bacterium]
MEEIKHTHLLKKQGLYDPHNEHDSCGVGFVCNIKGEASHSIVEKGIEVLKRLSHRGAVGADPETGDGAGLLIQIPQEFFAGEARKNKIDLPGQGDYGTGLIFLPPDIEERMFCKEAFYKAIEKEGQTLLGWRTVAVNDKHIGKTAKMTKPVIGQIFIKKSRAIESNIVFERKLYCIRKQVENTVRKSNLKQKSFFYITNLSSRTFIYKGLLMPHQLDEFFPELKDHRLESAITLVHSRYSTNTFPTWDLAQPFRFLAHNGEINTLRGNINWMRAREGLLKSDLFGDDIEKIKPILTPGQSDSATIDNAFELLALGGRPLYHAMMMLIPAAWESDPLLPEGLKSFYKYHGCFCEPWDGPAAIAFTDGVNVGAVLDRNGLRPARYIITKDGMVVMSSEAGVLGIEPENIERSLRLEPGKMLYIDTDQGRIVSDEELKEKVATAKPYAAWIKENMVELSELTTVKTEQEIKHDLLPLFKAFDYTREDLKTIILPMAQTGHEPTGSMGCDIPLAVFSQKDELLYDYFKQLFAQVTNPPIDSIREDCVMSMQSFVGPQMNILEETPKHCHKLSVHNPILTNEDLEKIKHIRTRGFSAKTISILCDIGKKEQSEGTDKGIIFIDNIDRICKEAEAVIGENHSFIILTDRGVSKDKFVLPALLAAAAVHHYLVERALRTQIGIIVESGEPREVHHFALLFGYGADCVNPYLAYEAIGYSIKDNQVDLDFEEAKANYLKALSRGILKILSKMGISTISSYRGAQIFEALGLSMDVIEKCFPKTASRIGGAGFGVLEEEARMRHKEAFKHPKAGKLLLPTGGKYKYRRDGKFHLWNPESIAALQDAARRNDYSRYKEFSALINDQSANPATLRSLLTFKKTKSIPLDQVEPDKEIFKRFATGAMSFGSISGAAHQTLALAMNRLGGKSNTGEGGEDTERFIKLPNGDSRRSAIKQVASGRFGVTTNYLVNADELQIKIAQGAKPGEGGQLPGHKVSLTIAKTRYTTPGVTLISPPPHHDIYSIEDLAQLIFDLKNTNPNARISVKLVSEAGVGTIAAGVAKGHADMILISGSDGGTGASPLSSIYYAGLPWELGLSEAHQTLVLNGLRSRVVLQTDGQIRTARDIAIAAMLGAEEYGISTAALVVMGCVMLRHCHLNNCSVGVATQDTLLEKRFTGSVEHVINYFKFIARDIRETMASLGIRSINELVGRADLLEKNYSIVPWKAKGIDYSRILYKPKAPKNTAVFCQEKQDHGIEDVLDIKLIKMAEPSLKRLEPVRREVSINNVNRTTGAMLSGEVVKRFGEEGLSEDTINFKFKGVCGQSFGAWLAKGITFELEGMANDYVGKGISGGKIIVYPDKKTSYNPQDNVIIGNTAFYGAICGEAYIKGVAGERFCIRNSGLYAVVEGVGDHGCEYMTGGRVVILGKTGRNFAAGMSGGIAYIYDEQGTFGAKCNLGMVNLERPAKDDKQAIYNLINNHYKYTHSLAAKNIVDNFDNEFVKFVKVIPIEYKRIFEGKKISEEFDLMESSDG